MSHCGTTETSTEEMGAMYDVDDVAAGVLSGVGHFAPSEQEPAWVEAPLHLQILTSRLEDVGNADISCCA